MTYLITYRRTVETFFVLFWQVTNFIERLMQNASNGEVLLFKKTLEQKFENLFVNTPGKKTFLLM
jgi:hypothetical protein